jgi:hypothetical protein
MTLAHGLGYVGAGGPSLAPHLWLYGAVETYRLSDRGGHVTLDLCC